MSKTGTIAETKPLGGPADAKTEAAATMDALRGFRRLKWNELVSRGDFVADENQGFEPWSGPSGFRADAFVKPIYRRQEPARNGGRKPH